MHVLPPYAAVFALFRLLPEAAGAEESFLSGPAAARVGPEQELLLHGLASAGIEDQEPSVGIAAVLHAVEIEQRAERARDLIKEPPCATDFGDA
jgi:hypothetical protein